MIAKDFNKSRSAVKAVTVVSQLFGNSAEVNKKACSLPWSFNFVLVHVRTCTHRYKYKKGKGEGHFSLPQISARCVKHIFRFL